MTATDIQRNARVIAADGEAGRVTHMIVEPRSGDVTDLVISYDGGEWLVPITELARVEDGCVVLFSDRHALTKGEAFRKDEFCPANEGRTTLPPIRSAAHGGVPLLQAKRPGLEEQMRRGAAGSAPSGGEGADDAPYRLRLREERLKVSAEPYQSGAVTLRTEITERIEQIEVPLRQEWLIVEPAPGTEPVRVGDRLLQDGEQERILLREERAVINTEVVEHEEVSAYSEVIERVEPVQATLRREELAIETDGDLSVTEGRPATPTR